MRFTFKSGVCTGSKDQMSALSGADCMEKQDLSDPQNQNSPFWPEVPVILVIWKLLALQKVCLHPFWFCFFPFPLHLPFRGVAELLRAVWVKLTVCTPALGAPWLQPRAAAGEGKLNKRRKCAGGGAGAASVQPEAAVAAAHPLCHSQFQSRAGAAAGLGTGEPLGWESPGCLCSLREQSLL